MYSFKNFQKLETPVRAVLNEIYYNDPGTVFLVEDAYKAASGGGHERAVAAHLLRRHVPNHPDIEKHEKEATRQFKIAAKIRAEKHGTDEQQHIKELRERARTAADHISAHTEKEYGSGWKVRGVHVTGKRGIKDLPGMEKAKGTSKTSARDDVVVELHHREHGRAFSGHSLKAYTARTSSTTAANPGMKVLGGERHVQAFHERWRKKLAEIHPSLSSPSPKDRKAARKSDRLSKKVDAAVAEHATHGAKLVHRRYHELHQRALAGDTRAEHELRNSLKKNFGLGSGATGPSALARSKRHKHTSWRTSSQPTTQKEAQTGKRWEHHTSEQPRADDLGNDWKNIRFHHNGRKVEIHHHGHDGTVTHLASMRLKLVGSDPHGWKGIAEHPGH